MDDESNQTITQRLLLLGFLRMLTLNNMCEIFFGRHSDEATNDLFADLQDNFDGVIIVAESLGLDLSRKAFFSADPTLANIHKFVTFLTDISITGDEVSAAVERLYGKKGRFSFNLAQYLTLARLLTSVFRVPAVHRVSESERPVWNEEKAKASKMVKTIGQFFLENERLANFCHGTAFQQATSSLGQLMTRRRFTAPAASQIHDGTEKLLNEVVPQFGEIDERIERYRHLAKALDNCQPGKGSWQDYESVCVEIMRFLFVPPFTQVRVEVRSEGNQERRDAILPNNQYTGFWKLIRDEFHSRHVIAEFKNSTNGGSKSWLNQLRIYLSKETIGRFGLLFVRKEPSQPLLQAQLDAYQQARILILILTDDLVLELLKNRAYLGTPNSVLESEKVRFEIEY